MEGGDFFVNHKARVEEIAHENEMSCFNFWKSFFFIDFQIIDLKIKKSKNQKIEKSKNQRIKKSKNQWNDL